MISRLPTANRIILRSLSKLQLSSLQHRKLRVPRQPWKVQHDDASWRQRGGKKRILQTIHRDRKLQFLLFASCSGDRWTIDGISLCAIRLSDVVETLSSPRSKRLHLKQEKVIWYFFASCLFYERLQGYVTQSMAFSAGRQIIGKKYAPVEWEKLTPKRRFNFW